jgi:uncharacterized membrane protein YeaQ/YmgE (transglycosylase-associated protein family)
MGILSWIVFGALAGWVAGILTRTGGRRGCIGNIIIGILGAFIGGFLMELINGGEFNFGFDMRSFVVALIGSVVLLALFGSRKKK